MNRAICVSLSGGSLRSAGASVGLFSLLLAISLSARALPTYLPAALEFGARDCGFCHSTPEGGHGNNERGQWLLAERDRRKAETIDVSWLAARDARVEVQLGEPVAQPGASLPRLPPLPGDTRRAMDYSTRHGDWPAYGGDLLATKYSPVNQVNTVNVAGLQQAWVWEAFDNARYLGKDDRAKTPDPFKATPIMAGNRLFIRTSFSAVVALDPTSGEVLWTFDPGTGDGPRPPMFGFSSRGLAYHEDKSGARILLLTSDGWLIALAAETGEPINSFGEGGRVDLTKGLRRELRRSTTTWNYPPALCGGVIVVGNQASDGSHYRRGEDAWNKNLPLGDVRGFDVVTGEQRWVFKTVPQEGEVGNETWENDSWQWMGNTNVWSTMSCDPALDHVYLPVSAPTHHFYGGFRPGDNLFGTAVVALKASTGERVWHFQTVRHDIWDYDLPAAPIVTDLNVSGAPVRALAQVSKTGFLFVLNRETGEPLWPVEERPVAPSSLAGEQAAKTQIFPSWPPPFETQGVSPDDLLDYSPALVARVQELVAGVKLGPLFTPATVEGTLINPGIGGGANWGGAAFDPESGFLFVPSRRLPTILSAQAVDEDRFGFKYMVRSTFPLIDGFPVLKPPWGSFTAYDLNTGKIAWQVANGPGPKDHPLLKDLDLPELGWLEAPGLLVAGDLIFYGHRGGNRDGTSLLQARSKHTGELIWSHTVSGTHSQAPPMTYLSGGKQFVVIATGTSTEPARLTAFRLP